MTVHQTPARIAEGLIPRTDESAVDLDRVWVRTLMRHQATVVTIRGDIDASNDQRVHDFATRFVAVSKGLILDLSGVEFFSAAGISVLIAVDEACGTADVEWALITNRVVDRVLRLINCDTALRIASSVPEALEKINGVSQARRRLALKMTAVQRYPM